MPNAAKPYWPGYERLQAAGDEALSAIGTTGTALELAGLKVVGTRNQGWTLAVGGVDNKGGFNATSVVGSAVTTSADTLSTCVLVLSTMMVELRKSVYSIQNTLIGHGILGTTIS